MSVEKKIFQDILVEKTENAESEFKNLVKGLTINNIMIRRDGHFGICVLEHRIPDACKMFFIPFDSLYKTRYAFTFLKCVHETKEVNEKLSELCEQAKKWKHSLFISYQSKLNPVIIEKMCLNASCGESSDGILPYFERDWCWVEKPIEFVYHPIVSFFPDLLKPVADAWENYMDISKKIRKIGEKSTEENEKLQKELKKRKFLITLASSEKIRLSGDRSLMVEEDIPFVSGIRGITKEDSGIMILPDYME